MELQIASINVQCPQNFMLQALYPPSSTSLFCLPSSSSAKWGAKNVNLVISVRSRKFLRYQYLDKNSCKSHSSSIQPCCSSRLCADFGEEHSEGCSYKSKYGIKGSFLQSEFESLEPKMLGIKPEPPYWPEREAILWSSIEQKAKSFGLPLSLRMIKKKHQCLPVKRYSEKSIFLVGIHNCGVANLCIALEGVGVQ
ncbi:hypothetical protein A4A49_38737 [Nicotiana attenuata]|uniref:Uncharacterized protein n=1 Tax=Nicotiana attenuata TaxID=49451 RepID=A0A1J6ID62_NICAT|nr:hypothetical protein A4A49_38737 [Nicotiana attenuata]